MSGGGARERAVAGAHAAPYPPSPQNRRLVTMSADLVWELTRKQNAFLRKGLNGTVFSTEKGNL